MEIHYNRQGIKNADIRDEADFAFRKLEKFVTTGRIPENDIKNVYLEEKFVGNKPYVSITIEFNKETNTWQSTKELLEMFFLERSNKIIVIDKDEIEKSGD